MVDSTPVVELPVYGSPSNAGNSDIKVPRFRGPTHIVLPAEKRVQSNYMDVPNC